MCVCVCDLVSLVSFRGLFNVKAILIDDQLWQYLTHNLGYKDIHTFSKGINSKVNVIVRLEFELRSHSPAHWSFRHEDFFICNYDRHTSQ